MSNSLLNISMITKESLRILRNNLGFSAGVNRQYDDQFADKGAKIGQVINIRKPVRYTVSNGPALVMQDITDQSVALTLSSQKHVGFQFSSKELTLNIDEFSDRYLKTAINALANQIDFDGMGQFVNVANAVGTPGTTPNTFLLAAQANQKLNENAAPVDDMRSLVVNPAASATMTDALKGLFQSSEQIKQQYEKGMMGLAAGFKWKMDQNVNSWVVGTQGGTPLSNGVNQTGATIAIDGWSNNITNVLRVGDVVTFAGVYAVNPVSFQTTGALKQFVVTASVNSNGSGQTATVGISPSVVVSGPYQNVTGASGVLTGIPDNSAVTVLGSTAATGVANLAYHRDAFVLGMADLDLPGGVDMAARATDPEAGLSIRIVRAYDINNDTLPCRLDVLYGWQTVYPELACRFVG